MTKPSPKFYIAESERLSDEDPDKVDRLTHEAVGTRTNKRPPGHIAFERIGRPLPVCVMPSILTKFSAGMCGMSAPGNSCVIVSL